MEKKAYCSTRAGTGGMILRNMHSLGRSLQDIDIIVLSHQHWDHIGGLNHVLAKSAQVDVYVPSSFSKKMKEDISKKSNLIEVSKPQKITENTYTTGELTCRYKLARLGEQSLSVLTDDEVLLVTGCAHPGLVKILELAGGFGGICGIVGGFHGFKEYDVLSDLDLIIPCHCTKHKKVILEKFPR